MYDTILAIIKAVAESSPTGLALKGGLLLIIALAGFVGRYFWKKAAADQAGKETQDRKGQDQADAGDASRDASQDARDSEKKVDDFFDQKP